jgi:hypothetical protein
VTSLKILPVKRHGEQTATIWKFRTMSPALRTGHVRAASGRNRLLGEMPEKSFSVTSPFWEPSGQVTANPVSRELGQGAPDDIASESA